MQTLSKTTRRDFLRAAGKAVVLVGLLPSGVVASPLRDRFRHPEPRPDVTGGQVLPSGEVSPHVAELFDGIRRIPHIADGIGCHCGCGAMPDMRSLLSCYEGIGMSQFCVICEGEGRLAVSMNAEGKSLDEIRAAIDRRFG